MLESVETSLGEYMKVFFLVFTIVDWTATKPDILGLYVKGE